MSNLEIGIIIAIIVIAAGILLSLWLHMRRQYISFREEMCDYVDQLIIGKMISEEDLDQWYIEEETLNSKLQMKLKQLAMVTNATKQINIEQKKQIQEMVSDISHQLKTPIANITMYSDTILNNDLPNYKKEECLRIIQNQVEKLDFLVKSLMIREGRTVE